MYGYLIFRLNYKLHFLFFSLLLRTLDTRSKIKAEQSKHMVAKLLPVLVGESDIQK